MDLEALFQTIKDRFWDEIGEDQGKMWAYDVLVDILDDVSKG